MPRLLLAILTLALWCPAASAQTPSSTALWIASDDELRDLERTALSVARAALGDAPRVTSTCDAADPGCVASMLRGSAATQVLAVRVHWDRGGCVPIRDADGRRTGSRMLRVRTVELELLASDGTSLGHRSVRVASDEDRAPIEAALRELLAH